MNPLSNRYLTAEKLQEMEPFFPLHAYICSNCLLVQLEEFSSPAAIFSDYAYFSSYSPSWLRHARNYVDMMTDRFGIDKSARVIEVASNDGYLLQYFLERGVPVLGIEPAGNVAEEARRRGVETLVRFFGVDAAREMRSRGTTADLLIGNNVLAHVPDINDFVEGFRILLSESGIVTLEFPHLMRLIEECQFDTIYHEHFSYISLLTAQEILARHKLRIFDVEELKTHGGSLRLFCCHEANDRESSESVQKLIKREVEAGLGDVEMYRGFSHRVCEVKRRLVKLLIKLKDADKSIAAYGAPAKGNTLLNYCGIGKDFIDFTVDRSPHKQGLYLPGTHIPILPVTHIEEARPDRILVLPWNLKEEIDEQLSYVKEWGCQLIFPIPKAVVQNEFQNS